MKLINRLIYFFVGLSIGLIFLAFLFQKKKTKFNYLPNSRVINDISSKSFHYSPKLLTAIAKNKITTSRVQEIVKFGEVNFSKSNTKLDSCNIYIIETKIDQINYSVELENCKNEVKIISYTLE
ncbi:MAG: DUF4258 domain-containing protein [Flavobacteriaceae bacterium]|nr:DUF4258 domain-containing protein [Flavobacteriaceae bacterium]CAI8363016.1 MAG: Uncharacterised protein [Flavobacteriaceae bacterium]|tara:strand:- start:5695 stop:6066 length:372 start_codon:yes stop_codon:yes gene_type:complete